eukprot:8387082-Pyramimonas_sp.AAC.1
MVITYATKARMSHDSRSCFASSPATMPASRAADASGLFQRHEMQQADAKQAHAQSQLGGTPT